MSARLDKITIVRQPGGGWELTRARAATAERMPCRDLPEAFAAVLLAYDENGQARPWPSDLGMRRAAREAITP